MIRALAILLAMTLPAAAHKARSGMEYSGWCCNGKDCAEVSDDAVREGPDGWIVTLRKGEHPMVTDDVVRHVVPYRDSVVRASDDGRFHVCLYPSQHNVRCFYAPGRMF